MLTDEPSASSYGRSGIAALPSSALVTSLRGSASIHASFQFDFEIKAVFLRYQSQPRIECPLSPRGAVQTWTAWPHREIHFPPSSLAMGRCHIRSNRRAARTHCCRSGYRRADYREIPQSRWNVPSRMASGGCRKGATPAPRRRGCERRRRPANDLASDNDERKMLLSNRNGP